MKNIVKSATKEDLPAINQLLYLSKSHWQYDADFLELYMKNYSITEGKIGRATVRLFYRNDNLAGFFSFIMNQENLLELDDFFLHPNYIGKGLGHTLWQACCDTAKELNRSEFIVWSDPHAENFYLKMGCEKIGNRPSPMLPNRFPPVLKYKILNK